jgi:hypothetical protein
MMVFKNGYGFVEESLEVPVTDGWFSVPDVPQASFGLLWLGTRAAGLKVDQAISEVKAEDTVEELGSFDELLARNEGARVALTLSGPTQTVVTGVLGRCFGTSRVVSGSSEREMSPFSVPPVAPEAAPGVPSPDYIMVTTDDGKAQLIPRHRVEQVAFETPPTVTRTGTRQVATMRARVTGASVPTSVPVSLTYMRKGVSWLPSYRVTPGDARKAHVTLDATLINDAADLNNSTVGFVVGVPNFVLQDMLSPLSVRMAWQGLSAYFGSGGPVPGGYSYLMTQQMANAAPARMSEARAEQPTITLPEEATAGSGEEDLFVYRLSGVTMPKGGRGLFRVLEGDASYEDVYLMTLEDDIASAQRAVETTISDPDLARAFQRPKVWHALRLTNTTSGPWTTGAAAVDWNGAATGQSILTFTPVAGTADLKLTVAPDVTAARAEKETKRELDALRTYNRAWNRVSLAGEIEIQNHRSTEARVIVRRRLTGTFSEASEGGSFSEVATSVYSVNPVSEAVWDLKVAPSSAVSVNFAYHVYVSY